MNRYDMKLHLYLHAYMVKSDKNKYRYKFYDYYLRRLMELSKNCKDSYEDFINSI